MASSNQSFINLCLHYLKEDYPERICDCLDRLSRDEINWRPNDTSNSIANLVCHLVGNCRQWVYQGLGNSPFERQREMEFQTGLDLDAQDLKEMLNKLKKDIGHTISSLNADTLDEEVVIQGFTVSKREALFHATEHFSMHTGQILYITKLIKDTPLDFYSISEGKAKPRWKDRGV